MFPTIFEKSPGSDVFKAISCKPSFISQPELQMVLSLDACVYEDMLSYHSLRHSSGQFKPFEHTKERVDYFLPAQSTIYEMLGCYYHVSPNCLHATFHRARLGVVEYDSQMEALQTRLRMLRQYFTVHAVDECLWRRMIATGGLCVDPALPDKIKTNSIRIAQFQQDFLKIPYTNGSHFTEATLLKDLEIGALTGLVKGEQSSPKK